MGALPRTAEILVVDDDDDVREALVSVLAEAGHRPACVANGKMALDHLLAGARPELILLDLRMPVMDGWTFRLEQRTHPHLAEIPVIAMSASDSPAAAAIDADEYLPKPVELGKLLETVERVLLRRDVDRSAETARRLAALVEASGDAIIGTSPDGVIEDWNPGAERLYGWTAAEVRGRSLALLDPGGAQQLVERVRGGDSMVGVEALHHRKDGMPAPVSISATPLVDAAGRVVRIAAIARDISERKRIEARLQMTERLASVGTLASGVAHEINNPLAYVATNLRFIAEEAGKLLARCGDEGMQKSLRDITDAVVDAEDGASRVQLIVRDLKTFARAGDERQSAIDLRHVLDAAINLGAHEIRPRARVNKQYQEVPPVLGNEARVGQLFLNLLLNAAQAIPEGAADSNEIRVSTRSDAAGRAVAEIADTGSGIPAEQLPRIFDPFFTTKPVGAGVGLGLAVVHGIVTAMGGEIAVESELGKGTRFRVTLLALHRAQSPSQAPRTAARPTTVRARLLIVDDEPALTNAVQRILAPEHDVVACGSGREALALLEHDSRFDMILCDLMMPDVTGIDLYERLLAEWPELAARVVFTTGGAFTPRARDFLDRVPNARLEKPFDFDHLRQLAREAATRR